MNKNSSKNLQITVLSILLLCTVYAAVYLLVTPEKKNIILNKYTDILNICDTQIQNDHLIIICKGLLLNINNPIDQQSCFETQIITAAQNLEDISFCESNEIFKYTNEILNYKKLLPIELTLSYSPTDKPNNYTLNTIELNLLGSEYIHDAVNHDIDSLISTNSATTTIRNSVDFCPTPELLPEYISEDNKQKYTEFYTTNILTEDEYKQIYMQEFQNRFLENWNSSTINILFGCESSSRLKYDDLCNKSAPDRYQGIKLTNTIPFVQDWNLWENTEDNLISIKNLSLVYDGILYQDDHINYSSDHVVNELFQYLNDYTENQSVYCNSKKVIELLASFNTEAVNQLESVRTLLNQNLTKLAPSCTMMLDDDTYDKNGKYLKALYTIKNNSIFTIYEKCNNLYLLLYR